MIFTIIITIIIIYVVGKLISSSAKDRNHYHTEKLGKNFIKISKVAGCFLVVISLVILVGFIYLLIIIFS